MEKDENIKEESNNIASEKDNATVKDSAEAEKIDSNGSLNETCDTDTANKSASDSNDIDDDATAETEEKDPLAEALMQVEAYKDKYLRSVAEFDNYRKRTLRERTELILNGSETAVKAMLPVVDDMERAIANSEKTDDMEVLKDGMKLIYQKFNKTLDSLGVKKIETADADFNTDYHEAVAMVPGMGDDKKGKVLDCVQTGYTLNDKVIRHAKVAVGQ